MTGLLFHSVGNGIIIPIDELIFFGGVGLPTEPVKYGGWVRNPNPQLIGG